MSPAEAARDRVVEAVRTALPAGRALPDVLEVGCGPHAVGARLRAELPQVALVAVDPAYDRVEAAVARGVAARIATTAELTFPDASYDVVVAVASLPTVAGAEDAELAELHRVLRPGGTLVRAESDILTITTKGHP